MTEGEEPKREAFNVQQINQPIRREATTQAGTGEISMFSQAGNKSRRAALIWSSKAQYRPQRLIFKRKDSPL